MRSSVSRTSAVIAVALAATLGLAGCLGLPFGDVPEDADEVIELEESTTPDETPAPDAADQSAALISYVAQAQASVPLVLDQFADTYRDFAILAVQPDTLEYAYYYLEQVDPATVVSYLEGSLVDFQDVVDTAVLPEMEAAGVTANPKVRYTYYNADGTLIWTYTFEKS